MLNKNTFRFKLYPPKCVYEIILLGADPALCKIIFCSVACYYSIKNPIACIFYFKLNFSGNLVFHL